MPTNRLIYEYLWDDCVQETLLTGNTVKKLKDGWAFSDGKLYRQPMIEDLDIDAILTNLPDLPQWVLDRMAVDQDEPVSTLIDKIKEILLAQSGGTKNDTDVAANHLSSNPDS